MTRQQAETLLVRLTAAFPRAEFPTPTAKLYRGVLEALPYERTRDAIEELLLTATFLPAIAEIVKAAGVEGDDTRKLAQAIREKKPLSRDYVFGWVVGEPLNPIPAQPAAPALPEPATVDVRAELATLKALMTGRAG
jgi:hypothetical protein